MDINIKDAAQNGTATAALMVATSLFMQVISNRLVATFSRYRSLTDEYRGGDPGDVRRDSLRDQIVLYRNRCGALRRAGQCLLVAELCFAVSIAVVIWASAMEKLDFLKPVFLVASTLGLLAAVVCAGFDMQENLLAKRGILEETKDLSDLERSERS